MSLCNVFNLDTAASQLLSALPYGKYGDQSIRLCETALRSLQYYISENNEQFELGKIVELVNCYFGNRQKTKRQDIIRFYTLLDEVRKFGFVRSNLFVGQRYYAFLSERNKQFVNFYLESLNVNVKSGTIFSYKNICSKLLLQFQIINPGDDYSSVTLEQIQAFVERTTSGKKSDRVDHQSEFIAYLHEQRKLSGCFRYWPHKMNRPHFFYAESCFDIEQITRFKNLSSEDPEFTPDVFHNLISEFIRECKNFKYTKSPLKIRKEVLKALYIFLDLNRLNYHFEIACQWADEFKGFRTGSNTVKKILYQFDDFVRNGTLKPTKNHIHYLTKKDLLPPYYKYHIQQFLDLKKKQGWALNTLDMYKSSVVRFCQYLADSGNIPFSALTPEIIMKFAMEDPHKTTQGRQAYLIRIKWFLIFLIEQGEINDQNIFKAVRTISAPQVRVVQILNTEQIEAILDFCRTAQTPLELRDSAMLLIGLKMGLRSIDVVNLKFSDIDWKKKIIYIIQQKTKVELRLPMPVVIGNAIYRYILNGRPESNCPYIFISHKAPFNQLSISPLTKALRNRVPHIKCNQGFHILRKSFASELLRQDISRTNVSLALGHSGTHTVDKYLNLNSERMRRCSLDLEEFHLSMDWGDLND